MSITPSKLFSAGVVALAAAVSAWAVGDRGATPSACDASRASCGDGCPPCCGDDCPPCCGDVCDASGK